MALSVERWKRRVPVNITGYSVDAIDVALVSLSKDGSTGRGEASGIFYREDRPIGIVTELESLRPLIEDEIDFERIQTLLPPGGARNALDCALWDLEAKLTGVPVWQRAGLEPPQPLVTAFTCHAATPSAMAQQASCFPAPRAIKLKLTGEPIDGDRVRAVRDRLPDVWLGIDANQGLTLQSLDRIMPVLSELGVSLIEQPLPIGREADLRHFESPIPLAADESFQTIADLGRLEGLFDVINIKLDKCGGLSEALDIAHMASQHGFEVMVGNMSGTSLAMAPAFLVGQNCQVVDLDGPALLACDRDQHVIYSQGTISCPHSVWGY